MPWAEPSVVDTLAAECDLVSGVVLSLGDEEFSRPTRCPAWDVKGLLGHMYRDVDRILEFRDLPAPARPDATAVTYWRRYDPAADAPEIAERSQAVADRYGSGADLARAFDGRWREAVDAAREMEPDRLIRTFAPTMRLDEYVKTRVLEIAVHGLDLADGIGRRPWISSDADDVVRSILVGLLGSEPPDSLGWDRLTFVETGTGRRPLAVAERDALGDRADLFPLLA